MPAEQWISLRQLLLWVDAEVNLADVVPAIEALRRQHPSVQIKLFAVDRIDTSAIATLDVAPILTADSEDVLNNSQSIGQQSQYYLQLVQEIGDYFFDTAIIFTAPLHSPFSAAYLCYLAGIPLRIGQSSEFGGVVLSTCVQPPVDFVNSENYYLHLLRSAGFIDSLASISLI